jgi:hypothetical protein
MGGVAVTTLWGPVFGNFERRAGLVAGLLATILVAQGGTSPGAQAGTYDVVACNSAPGYVNNAWSLVRYESGGGSVQCPTGAGIEASASAGWCGGETTAATLVSTNAFSPLTSSCMQAPGGEAKWIFTAPAGTTLQSFAGTWRCYRSHYAAGIWWLSSPHGGSGSGTCNSSSFTAVSRTFNAGATTLELGARFPRCLMTEPGCSGHYVRAALGESRTTIRDDHVPTLTVTGGSIHAGGWHDHMADIRFDASDNVGIRLATLSVDGTERARRDFPCDFTWAVPCSNQPNQSLSFDTAGLSEGSHNARLTVVDAAGNQTHSDHTFKVDRAGPVIEELEGTLKDPDTPWAGAGSQDLGILASDASGTGVTRAELRVDGALAATLDQGCPAGGCDLDGEMVVDTNPYAPGDHTLTVTVRDASGNATSESWTTRLERDAPALVISGPLVTDSSQPLTVGERYELIATASDTAGSAAQAGIGRVAVAVDDDAPDSVEQACPGGACSLTRSFDFVVDDYEPGPHTITVTATDLAGNETVRTLLVNTAEPPAPRCESAPSPTLDSAAIPPISAAEARQQFEQHLPEALQPNSAVSLGPVSIQPSLIPAGPLFEAIGSMNRSTVAADPQAAAITVHTDDVPICFTPAEVGTGAIAPDAIINDAAVLYANSRPGVDTLVRPTVAGVKTFLSVRSADAARQFSWHVALHPDLALKQLPDGSAAVVELAEPGSPLPAPVVDGPASPPTVADQRQAIADTSRQASYATDANERAYEATPDEVEILIPKPWAVDAAGSPVPVSLSVEGSTLRLSFDPQGGAFPVMVDPEFVAADSLDEWEAQKSDGETADYPYTESENYQPPSDGTPVPAAGPGDPADGPEDFATDPSSQSRDEFSDTEQDVAFASVDAAAAGASPPKLGLTESQPAMLYSPRRIPLGPRFYRPIVPWRIMRIINNPTNAQERRAKRRWQQWYERAEQLGLKSDIAIQFLEGDRKAPPVSAYKRHLRRFLDSRYASVIDNLGAWNEPNLNNVQIDGDVQRNPTWRNPRRAARYWVGAQQVCHQELSRARCNNLVAGEFAGKGRDDRVPLHYRCGQGTCTRRVNYQETYRRYLFSELQDENRGVPNRRKLHRPFVWSFHDYNDPNRFQLYPQARTAPVAHHYFTKYNSDRYRHPRIWMTAGGAHYHRACEGLRGDDRDEFCPNPPPPGEKQDLLLGMRKQANGLVKLLRYMRSLNKRAGSHPGIVRFYYYRLHFTDNAGTYSPEHAHVVGKCCARNDSGLVGSRNDPELAGAENSLAQGASDISNRNEPRLIYCAFRRANEGNLRLVPRRFRACGG